MPFPASRGRCIPWLPTPPPSLEPAMASCSLVTLHLSSSLPLLGCLWLKWPTWLIQGHLPGLKSADWQSLWGHYSVRSAVCVTQDPGCGWELAGVPGIGTPVTRLLHWSRCAVGWPGLELGCRGGCGTTERWRTTALVWCEQQSGSRCHQLRERRMRRVRQSRVRVSVTRASETHYRCFWNKRRKQGPYVS